MRASSVLSEGLYPRPHQRRSRSNLFVQWEDTEEFTCLPAPPYRSLSPTKRASTTSTTSSALKTYAATHRRTRVDLFDVDEDSSQGWWNSVLECFREAFGSHSRLRLMLDLARTEAVTRKGAFLLSFCSVSTVVCVCVVMLTILSSFAIVSLRMAEDIHGSVDLLLTPGGAASDAASLNYTHIAAVLQSLPPAQRIHSYRVVLGGTARVLADCTPPAESTVSLWYEPHGEGRNSLQTTCLGGEDGGMRNRSCVLCQASCVEKYCQGMVASATLVVLDARTDPAATTDMVDLSVATVIEGLAYGDVAISVTLAGHLSASIGDTLLVTAVMDTTLRHLLYQIPSYESVNPNLLLSLRVRVIVDDDYYPDGRGNRYVLIPPNHFTSLIADSMAPSISVGTRNALRCIHPAEYATSVVFQMPDAMRNSVYRMSDFVTMSAAVRDWGKSISEALGANQVTTTTPLLSVLRVMQYFASFVGLLISIVVLGLGLLSVLVIYTMLSIGMETKAYELAIQRMLGFTRLHLALLVLTNTYLFAVPATLTGLVLGQCAYWVVRSCLLAYVNLPLDYGVSASALGWGLLVGVAVPLIAALLPIRALITSTLPDALDTTRSHQTGVIYRIQRGRSREANALIFGLGVLAALAGMGLYLFFPTSLITLNFALLFYILFAVLFGMLAGLVLLATNFERVVETALGWVFLWWETPAVRSMVVKSLSAHRRRNMQTTIMYALSIGFVVFLTVAFKNVVNGQLYSNARSRAADVTLYLNPPRRPTLGVTPAFARRSSTVDDGHVYTYTQTESKPENLLSVLHDGKGFFFEDLVQLDADLHAAFGPDVVTGVSFRSSNFPTANLWPVSSIRTHTFGRRGGSINGFCAIPPNFFDVADSRFIKVSQYDAVVGQYGLGGGLYAADGARTAIIATTAHRVFGMSNTTDEFLWETRVSAFRHDASSGASALSTPQTAVFRSAGRAVAVMDSSPSFLMTKFPNSMGEVLVSLPVTARLMEVPYLSCNVLSLSTVFVRTSSPTHYEAVKSFFRAWFSDKDVPYSVNDLTSSTEDTRTVDTIFTAFFVLTQVMIMLICFLSLMSSMAANVMQSAKEIGIVLCLGMTHFQIYRVYIWEAFLLVVSSASLGLLVGMTLAETLVLQQGLFTQLSLPFPFPAKQMYTMVAMGLLSAVASSVSPVTFLLRLPSIPHILRRVV